MLVGNFGCLFGGGNEGYVGFNLKVVSMVIVVSLILVDMLN